MRAKADYPLFGKPIAGSYGSGCFALEACDRESDELRLANQQVLPLEHYVDLVEQYSDGYLFQSFLRSHRLVRKVCGPTLATVRVLVLLERGETRIQRATWKIPTGSSMVDNFQHGRVGNLLAAIDLESGRVVRVVRGVGTEQQEMECHPDTGERIQGFVLPHWAELRALCLEASRLLPGFRLQSWDIAICDDGPLIQEVQPGDFDLLQHAARKGLLDSDFQRFLGSVNKHWRLEILFSMLDQMPRKLYRTINAKRAS